MVPNMAACASSGSLLKKQVLGPTQDLLNQNVGLKPALCGLTSPLGDFNACLHSRVSQAKQRFFHGNEKGKLRVRELIAFDSMGG